MKERDITTRIMHWLRARHKMTGAFEIKITHGKSLPFSALAPHQADALRIANNGVFCHKIADMGYFNPLDAFCLVSVPAFVVVMFYKRGQKEFFMIPIKNWISEELECKRKSLTPERAAVIGIRCEL